MVTFAHMADCHLGCWRQPELQKINFESFRKIVDICIETKVDFILIAGDLFDSAYPSIEILKETFQEFKKIHDNNIPVYLIAGSHDFSTSGKTFLDVLEKAGFCKNVEKFTTDESGRINLEPTYHEDIAIFGYPGKKSGMEIEDLKKVHFEKLNAFTIFMLHTTIKDVVGTIPMDSIEKEKLPLADYYAFGHIHKYYNETLNDSRFVYPTPTFPANFQELIDLKCGSFVLVEIENNKTNTKRIQIPLKEVSLVIVDIDNGLTATQKIISELDKHNLNDKITLLKLRGIIQIGKAGDINFKEIEDFVKKKGAYVFLRNMSSLKLESQDFDAGENDSDNIEKVEERIFKEFSTVNSKNNFTKYLPTLMNVLSMEKAEDEKSAVFEDRLLSELKDLLEMRQLE
ncbi:DNA repair exonuclease [archaeon]|jgi:DNA repair protein SbcD/Mre11|nr:DNA repair exonuclease [archaeon]MBT6182839.1 DNA repair exonuclease [archaeon]MBT6606799.1 DNA repair exonuclease [archaeon]MBT7251728.1 DNA repair exonuclease [archaeon]MBT7660511.1 DNA repair exonuclease [archaeon]